MRNDAPAPVHGFLKRLAHDRKGVIAMVAAIAFPILITLAGFGTELAYWYSAKRQLQGVADSAALAAAFGMQAGESNTLYSSEATGVAGYNGFVTGTNNVTVTVNSPPTMGNYTTDSNAVEVIIQQPVSKTLTAALGTASVTLAARAVGGLTPTKQTCALSLTTIAVTGSGSVVATGCTIAADSTSSSAISLSGSGGMTAQAIESSGGTSRGGSGNFSPAPNTNVPAITAPTQVTGVNPSTPSSCSSATALTVSASTPNPVPSGCYTSMTFGTSTSYTLSGNYWIVNNGMSAGSLSISASGSVSGTGVAIFLTSTLTSVCPANVNLSGSGGLTLSAPTSGSYQGVAIYQYEPSGSTCSTAGSSGTAGSGGMDISGLVYLPDSSFASSGSGGFSSSGNCNILIADSISYGGSGGLTNSGCATYGGAAVFNNVYSVALIE